MESVLTYTNIANFPIVAMSTRCYWGAHCTKLRLPIPRQTAPSTVSLKNQCSALTLTASPPSSQSELDRLLKVTQSMDLLMTWWEKMS